MAHVTAAHHVRNLWRGLGQRQKHQRRIRGDDYTGAIVPLGLSAVKGCVARRGERADVHPCKQPCAGMWGIPAHSFRLKKAEKDKKTNPHNHCNPNLSPQLAPTYAASTTTTTTAAATTTTAAATATTTTTTEGSRPEVVENGRSNGRPCRMC